MGLIKRYAYRVTPVTTNVMNNQLWAHWPLQEPNGVRYDFSTDQNNLSDINTVGFSNGGGPGGAYPSAAEFVAASSEHLQAADSSDFDVSGEVDMAFCCWVRLADKATNRTLASKWDNTTGDEWVVRYNQASDRFEFVVSHDGTGQSGAVLANAFGSPSATTWYFIFAYHSATTNEIGISVNNGAFTTAAYSQGIFTGAAVFMLGAQGGVGSYMNGRLAGASFFKNGIPSAADRTALYNGGVPRDPWQFNHLDLDDGGIWFELGDYEYAPSQALRVPRAPISGADYDFRLLGYYPGLKGQAQERIRFTAIGDGAFLDALTDLQLHMQNYGLLRLWTIGDDGSERWCWASLANMPEYTLAIPTTLLPTVLMFDRWSDWYDKFQSVAYMDAANTGDTIVSVITDGNALSTNGVLDLMADSWTNPIWDNTPIWYGRRYDSKFSTSRDISTNLQRIRADGGNHLVGWSTNNGSSFTNDYANYTRQAGQTRLIAMPPDFSNNFLFQGTRTNARAYLRWFNAWHS